MKRNLYILLYPLVVLSSCTTTPPVDDGLSPALTAIVGGDATILVPLQDPHPVVLFITAIVDGVPAERASNVTVIPAELLEAGDGPDGPVRVGSYIFPQIAPGDYYVTGIVDVDENFNPLVPEAAGPTAPDLLGAYINPQTQLPLVVSADAGEDLEEVNVLFAVPAASGQ